MSMVVKAPSNRVNGLSSMNSRYALTYSNVNTLLSDIEDPNFFNNITKLFADEMDNLISLVCFPFDVKNLNAGWVAQADGAIIININQTQNAKGTFLNPITTPVLTVGHFEVPRIFNSFLDYKPYTRIVIYLPYIGFEELDNDEVMGNEIDIEYAVDLVTGKCTAFVSLYDPDEAENVRVIMTREGQCGVRVPISGGSGSALASSILSAGAAIGTGTVGLVASGIGAGAAVNSEGVAIGGSAASVSGTLAKSSAFLGGSSVNAIAAGRLHVKNGGAMETNSALYAPQTPFMLYYCPKVNRPTNYDHDVGRPSGKTATLGTLTGYTVVDNVHVEGQSGFAQATSDEITRIDSLLRSGIIL